jgi:hypothetical protein
LAFSSSGGPATGHKRWELAQQPHVVCHQWNISSVMGVNQETLAKGRWPIRDRKCPGARVLCRTIEDADLPAVVDLLVGGFAERTREFWQRAVDRLVDRDVPAGYPRYGLLLEAEGRPVGVILLIHCSVSSWYVVPQYRALASVLISRAFKRAEVTYVNVTPALGTETILGVQGYSRYVTGRFVAIPGFSPPWSGTEVESYGEGKLAKGEVTPWEEAMLVDHARLGCHAVISRRGGKASPFVFTRHGRTLKNTIPQFLLVYCRSIDQFAAHAGPLARHLLRGRPAAVAIDANGPIEGLHGLFRPGQRRNFRGPRSPRLGDLASTEFAVLGL